MGEIEHDKNSFARFIPRGAGNDRRFAETL